MRTLTGYECHALDPQRYLTSVLAKIGPTSNEELTQFLLDQWAKENTADPEHG